MAKKKQASPPSRELELPVSTSLDQPTFDTTEEVLQAIRQGAEALVKKAIEHKDPGAVLGAISQAAEDQQMQALKLACIVWHMAQNWEAFDLPETFYEYAEASLGKSAHTLKRYFEVWDLLAVQVPDNARSLLSTRPIRQLVAVAQRVRKVGRFTSDQYVTLALTSNGAELRTKLDEYSGRKPSESKRLVYAYSPKTRTLSVRKGGRRTVLAVIPPAIDLEADGLAREAWERLLARLEVVA